MRLQLLGLLTEENTEQRNQLFVILKHKNGTYKASRLTSEVFHFFALFVMFKFVKKNDTIMTSVIIVNLIILLTYST